MRCDCLIELPGSTCGGIDAVEKYGVETAGYV